MEPTNVNPSHTESNGSVSKSVILYICFFPLIVALNGWGMFNVIVLVTVTIQIFHSILLLAYNSTAMAMGEGVVVVLPASVLCEREAQVVPR